MQSPEPSSSSPVLLNIGGKKYATTVETLMQREPDSMLAAMFSGRHTLHDHPTTGKGVVFVDRDGKHFRHVLNWLRDGAIPVLSESDYQQLLREAEYYQLLGLVDYINERLGWKETDNSEAELTRKDVIKCIQTQRVRFRGVNLSGLDLSKLDLSEVDFSYACIKNTDFSYANLYKAKFGQQVEASSSSFQNAILRVSLLELILKNLFWMEQTFEVPIYKTANLTQADLRGANLEAANLKGAKLSGTNLQGANLQRAYLREVDLRDTVCSFVVSRLLRILGSSVYNLPHVLCNN
ncbi:FH protein interacting protein FIP2 isoform X4 [Zea mays]|uniref:FH protein interacting protein FIP2 isoform X4 n=1 Tax=Zea mays TaxID=4577 RepID=UPI0009A9A805|nr:uncharacterized protein LOC100283682 isoform X4 [Zea mays]|eukprot:XP_020399274.1 uncharacterized protein LOC100283682 isoform X4 [Zea mays]